MLDKAYYLNHYYLCNDYQLDDAVGFRLIVRFRVVLGSIRRDEATRNLRGVSGCLSGFRLVCRTFFGGIAETECRFGCEANP